MGSVHPVEWTNFVAALRRQPWRLPIYGVQIFMLALRRIYNKIRHSFGGSNHKGTKSWPSWLSKEPLNLKAGITLNFPLFEALVYTNVPEHVSTQSEDDPEWYFRQNRWGECISAMMLGESDSQVALESTLRWIEKSIPKSDRAWEPYSACERAVNLAVLLAVHPRLANDHAALNAFFVESLQWINDHLEYYGPQRTNNHILNNARALVVLGVVLNNKVAIERGLIIFSTMAADLFQTGGFLRERSSHYQLVVSNWLLDTVHFAQYAQVTSTTAKQALSNLLLLSKRVIEANSVLINALAGAGTHIGDISPDIHPDLSVQRLLFLYSSTAKPQLNESFIDDWIFIEKENHSIVACVMPKTFPIKYTTHGHSDLGSFIWRFNQHSILVDAGRFRYTNDQSSLSQIAPAGHNTLLINNSGLLAESLLLNGIWRPEPYASASIETRINSNNGFTIKHNGLRRINHVGMHERNVCIEQDALQVQDSIGGDVGVVLETLWHFPPDFFVPDLNLAVVQASDFIVRISNESLRGDHPVIQWDTYPFSPVYGEVQTAPMLRLKWHTSLPCTIKTIFRVELCAE